MKKISNAELEVMKVIWKKGEITSNEIIKELSNKSWTDNTVRTLINRLVNKKVVGISKYVGKLYYYVPLVKENEYKKFITNEFIKKMFNGSITDFLEVFYNKKS